MDRTVVISPPTPTYPSPPRPRSNRRQETVRKKNIHGQKQNMQIQEKRHAASEKNTAVRKNDTPQHRRLTATPHSYRKKCQSKKSTIRKSCPLSKNWNPTGKRKPSNAPLCSTIRVTVEPYLFYDIFLWECQFAIVVGAKMTGAWLAARADGAHCRNHSKHSERISRCLGSARLTVRFGVCRSKFTSPVCKCIYSR